MNQSVHALAALQDALEDLLTDASQGITVYLGEVPPLVQRKLLDQTQRLARAMDEVLVGGERTPEGVVAFFNGPAGALYASAIVTLGGMLLGRRVAHLEGTATPYQTVVGEILALCTPHVS